MNCRNCGGAMELVATRGYFFCKYCGSFHFPESFGDDGVRVVADGAGLDCAVCDGPMASAMLDEVHPVRYCQRCRGVLMARTGFAAVVERRRAWASDPPSPPVPLNRTELDRKVTCPSCQHLMATHPYYGPGNVVIDTCDRCEAVWLDCGELKQIVAAPGKDRGNRDQVPRTLDDSPVNITGARLVGGGAETFATPSTRPNLIDLLARLF